MKSHDEESSFRFQDESLNKLATKELFNGLKQRCLDGSITGKLEAEPSFDGYKNQHQANTLEIKNSPLSFSCNEATSYKTLDDVQITLGDEIVDNISSFHFQDDRWNKLVSDPKIEGLINGLKQRCLEGAENAKIALKQLEEERIIAEKARAEEIRREAFREKKLDLNIKAYNEKYASGNKYKFYSKESYELSKILTSITHHESVEPNSYMLLSNTAKYKLTYKVAEPLSNGYRLTLDLPDKKRDQRYLYPPIILETNKSLIVGKSIEGKIDLIRYEGLINYSTVMGSLVQAAKFVDTGIKL